MKREQKRWLSFLLAFLLVFEMFGAAAPEGTRTAKAAAPLVKLQTEIGDGEQQVKFYFDKPLSAYGIDVETLVWWGYSDGPSGIVGIGNWTDDYVELTGNEPGTLTLNWKTYDKETYQYGDYALKISVTVKEKQTAGQTSVPGTTKTPVPKATSQAVTPAPAATAQAQGERFNDEDPEPDIGADLKPEWTLSPQGASPSPTATPPVREVVVVKEVSKYIIFLQKGKTKTLKLNVKKSKKKKIIWSSANIKIVSVTKKGKIKAKKVGKTKIKKTITSKELNIEKPHNPMRSSTTFT